MVWQLNRRGTSQEVEVKARGFLVIAQREDIQHLLLAYRDAVQSGADATPARDALVEAFRRIGNSSDNALALCRYIKNNPEILDTPLDVTARAKPVASKAPSR